MKSFSFIPWLTYAQLLFHLGCATDEHALVILESETGLEFAPVATDVSGKFNRYVTRSQNKKLLYLCPKPDERHGLKLSVVETLDAVYGPAKTLCRNPVEPSIVIANVPRANDQGEKIIYPYYSGFAVDDDRFKHLLMPTAYVGVSNDVDYYFMPMITFFRNIRLRCTVAVDYKIIEVDVRKQLENKTLAFKTTNFFFDYIETFYLNQETELRKLLGSNYVENEHVLVLDSLVNENDFIIDSWKKTAHFKAFQILIWEHNLETWRNVREFVRYVAGIPNSRTNITAGIGQPLILKVGEDHKSVKMEWVQEDNTIFIPQLYWVSIQYTKNQKTTGMFVIMHNEPNAADNNVEKICDTNLCLQNDIWTPTDEYESLRDRVYCCPMDFATISKLNLKFLSNALEPFNGIRYFEFPPRWPEKKD